MIKEQDEEVDEDLDNVQQFASTVLPPTVSGRIQPQCPVRGPRTCHSTRSQTGLVNLKKWPDPNGKPLGSLRHGTG